jgi:hypothetical protein
MVKNRFYAYAFFNFLKAVPCKNSDRLTQSESNYIFRCGVEIWGNTNSDD